MNKNNKNRGYIALMATIIISMILLVMAVEESSSGWSARFNILGTEAKEQASSLAEGCAEQATASLLTDPSFVGGTTITTSFGTCNILPIQLNFPVAGLVTIQTQAIVRGSYANLNMAMNMNDIHFGSIATPPASGTIFITTHVINDGGGTNQAVDFKMHVNSINPIPDFDGTEVGYAVHVTPGPYSVSQTNLANYSVTSTGNCNGNIIAGELKFCTITNDDTKTTLTIIANVTNDDNGANSPADFPLFIDGVPVVIGIPTSVSAGIQHVITATNINPSVYAVSSWGYDCDALGKITVLTNQTKTCIINFNDIPPPAPSCADTVMILDRTGSMFSSATDVANEKAAANSLVNLYSGVLPPAQLPQLGVGSIGGLDGSAASVPLLGQLSTIYVNVKSAITSMMNTSSSVGSDLSAGIITASAELNSVRHVIPEPPTIEKKKVIILVSDGDPNEPSGITAFNTGLKSPTSNAQNSVGEFWTTANLAYADGGGDADDPVSENDRQQFSNFGFGGGSGLPNSVTVTGIEAVVDTWATGSVINTPANISRSPSGIGLPNQWSSTNSAFVSDNNYATESTNGDQQVYTNFGFNIPANATITGIQVTSEAKISGGALGTTATLLPNGQGSQANWTNGESTVDEVGTPDCGSSDSIIESTNNDRESVIIDASSIPNGATITDVTISVYDRSDSNNNPSSNSGGTYKTFVRLDGTNFDASLNLAASSVAGSSNTCSAVKSQNIDVTNTVKGAGTSLEIGVVKTNGNNNSVRVGAIRAVVAYTLPPSGSVDISLSQNNGTSYTALKTTTLSATESVTSPTGNNSTDLWGRIWTPSELNNGNFVLKIGNSSPVGTTVSLDQVIVNVFYTTPVSAGTSCQIGIDLSWNNGTNWSTEKTQNINGVETTYTLGASNDDWSGSHVWTPAEFSNVNFKARVRAIDPGINCDNTAINHLDWLQLKVHYTQNIDPIEASLIAADTAKLAGIDIFTIHFGADTSGYAGKELLANLAGGTSAITYSSGHQNGSFADPGGVVNGSSGIVSPTAQTPTSGGDGNGFENTPGNALSDGPNGIAGAAQNIDGAGDRHIFSGYNFVIPPGATITGIQTRLDWWLDSTSGTNSMNVELSWDGGVSWTAAKSDGNESTNTGNSRTLGANNDTWGHAWTVGELNPAKFKVRVTSNSTIATRDFYLDWIPVTISYSVNTENGDGDNFFVAPTSADMQGIFNYIGQQVCPASLNIASTPPPTTGTIVVMTNVINNNGGTSVPADFIVNITATNPSQNNFVGNSSGISITVSPGSYDINQSNISGYTVDKGATCTSATLGNISAGETRICILNNDDIAPPPPPPNLNLDTNTWNEIPNPTP